MLDDKKAILKLVDKLYNSKGNDIYSNKIKVIKEINKQFPSIIKGNTAENNNIDNIYSVMQSDMYSSSHAHGWIQWKGTDVCMDIHCTCGELCHIDDDFVYYIQCPHCNRVYINSGYNELIEVKDTKVHELCLKVAEL